MDKSTVKKINDHVWLIRDEHNDTCYLIEGSEKAMLVDTMSGYLDIRETAEGLTRKPITVVNTHGHGDHVLGNVWFPEAWIHPADLPMIEEMLQDPELKDMMEKEQVTMCTFRTCRQGDTFDLGGLTVQVVELPGHTPGGICLLLKEDRMLFTGDSINRHLWMQLEGCCSLQEYGQRLDDIAWVKAEADWILHGHADHAEPITLLDELRRGIGTLVTGDTSADTEYKWFGGVCKQHPFAEGSVIVYQPQE